MVDISSQMNTKIRFVRCPRCWGVLKELPEIPVYKCGGCGTILQAKNRKNNNNGTEISSDKKNSMQNYDHDTASESSNQETTPFLESSPASDHKGEQSEIENHKQPGAEFSDELPSSTELGCHGNETESPEARESMEEGKHKGQVGQDANKNGNEALNRNIHWPGSNVLDELPGSTEHIFYGNETLSPEARESTGQGEANYQSGQDARKSGDESLNCNSQQPSSNVSDELLSSTGVSFQVIERLSPEASEPMEQGEHKFQLTQDARKYGNEELNCNSQQPGTNFSDELPSTTELSCHGNERLSQETKESREQGKHQYASRQDARKDRNESPNHNSPQPSDRTFSDELVSSGELSSSKNEDSSPEIREPMMQDDDRSSLKPNIEKYAKESEDDCLVPTGDGKSSNELHSSVQLSHQDNEYPPRGVSECIELNMGKDLLEQYPSRDHHNSPQPGDRTSSDELVNSGELSSNRNEDSSPEIREPMMQDDDRSSLKSSIEKYAKESENDCLVRTGDGKSSNELHSSVQLSHQDNVSPSRGVSECIELNMGKDLLEQYPSQDQTETEDYEADKPESNNFPTVVPLIGEGNHQSELSSGGGAHRERDASIYHSEDNDGEGQQKFSGQIESSQNIESAREASPSPLVASHKVAVSSTMTKTYTDVNEENLSNSRTSNVESSLSSMKGNVLVAAQSPLNEGVLSENLSPYEKYVEQSQKNVLRFDRVGSDESLVSLPTIPRYALGAMSKSPTRIYYGGDASVSSYEGNDDQISDWPSHSYKGKFKATDPPLTHRSRRTDGFKARKMQDSKLEMHHDQTASPSIFAEKNINAITGQEWSHDELPQPRRQSSAIRRMRFDTNDPISRKPYISRSSHLVHGNGSPSSQRQNVFQHHSRFNLPDTASYTEPDKMEMLRMVYELEDKLNRTRVSHWIENERFSSEVHGYEKHTPTLYDDLETDGNIYSDYENSIYRDSFPQGVGWLQQSDISRMAFSGEAAYRHQVDCLCSHCYPHDWQRSRHLPSHFTTSSKFHCPAPPSHNRQKAFTSFSSTPQHHTSFGFSSWGQEINSDNQKSKDNKQKRLYLREKYHTAKRHIRPMASGAPIVTCCHCSELLQLPVDFLIYKKQCHQLRCNSCNKILKFSLKKMGHLVPYVPNASTAPSEIDEDGVAANSRTLAPASNSNHSPHAEPVSFSDDYDPSYCKSYSTEQEPSVLLPASCSLQKNAYKKKMSSSDSIQPIEGRIMNSISRNSQSMHQNSGEAFELVGTSSKMSKWGKFCSETHEVPATSGSPLHQPIEKNTNSISRNSIGMNENSGEAFESVGTSSKISQRGTLCSEIEELPAPLHKLMGYSSPDQVLYASPGDESEEEMR